MQKITQEQIQSLEVKQRLVEEVRSLLEESGFLKNKSAVSIFPNLINATSLYLYCEERYPFSEDEWRKHEERFLGRIQVHLMAATFTSCNASYLEGHYGWDFEKKESYISEMLGCAISKPSEAFHVVRKLCIRRGIDPNNALKTALKTLCHYSYEHKN